MNKKDIRRLLGSDLAQKDKCFLEYAVKKNELIKELGDPDNGLMIINSPRGSGKSGLVILHEVFLKKSSEHYVVIKNTTKRLDFHITRSHYKSTLIFG